MSIKANETKLYNGEIIGLRKLGYKIKIPTNTVFGHGDQKLIATKKFNKQTVKVFMLVYPAHFFEIIVPSIEGRIFKITTGSGSVEEYLEALEPAIDMMTKGMVVIKEEKRKIIPINAGVLKLTIRGPLFLLSKLKLLFINVTNSPLVVNENNRIAIEKIPNRLNNRNKL